MSFRKFKFISPGVFVNEIDNSQLPREGAAIGPVVIGRAQQGPGMVPIKVNSFDEFVQTFGNPVPGAVGGDAWRYGDRTAPTYAAYAAQAWLRNNTPLTFVRLLGRAHSDAGSAGYAGWQTTNLGPNTTAEDSGGAYGLFIVEGTGTISSINGQDAPNDDPGGGCGSTFNEGTLAAVWYCDVGSIELSGTRSGAGAGNLTECSGASSFFNPVDANLTFKAVIKDGNGAVQRDATFDFTPTSPNFIRKVFNTTPSLTNSSIMSSTASYWLGESYEGWLSNVPLSSSRQGGPAVELSDPQGKLIGISGSIASNTHGIILALGAPNATVKGSNFKVTSTKALNAVTGWFIGQDFGTPEIFNAQQKQRLFRLASRHGGEDVQSTVKVSIQDIKRSTDPYNEFGTFSVVLRDIKDTDSAPIIVEQYTNCNLNPASDSYVAKKIGNTYFTWSDEGRRYQEYGDYPNQSKYVRVEMNTDVDRGVINTETLPFGVYGPIRYLGFAASGTTCRSFDNEDDVSGVGGTFVMSGSGIGHHGTAFVSGTYDAVSDVVNARFKFPALHLRASSSQGNLGDPKDAYWGADTTYKGNKFNESTLDVLRGRAAAISNQDIDSDYTEYSWVFTLDDIRNEGINSANTAQSALKQDAVYMSGSRARKSSYTAHTGSTYLTASYNNVLAAGWDRFTTCMYGGFDALDIREREAFNNTRALSSDKTALTSYAFNSVKMAMDSVRDSERIEMNLVAMPGVTNNSLNRSLIRMAEDRGDTLAIVDLQGGYKPDTEDSSSVATRIGSVDDTVNNARDTLKVNSSYGCAYYPWLQIRDTINQTSLWAPPSIAALGTMAYSETTSQLWFAPAGFTRGGLTANNTAGIPVINVRQKLTSKERDKLYDANINPIASFPAEGIVIFGQKTLQVTPSAMDRINVRRLLIFLKKQISRMAATVLFDQNVDVTWNRFISLAEPFLKQVKAGLGLTAYKFILDSTTTTPDLIDRNIMYAKIIVQPARAIEFIALDFVITNSGASFED